MLFKDFEIKVNELGYVCNLSGDECIRVRDEFFTVVLIESYKQSRLNVMRDCSPDLLNVCVEFANTPVVERYDVMTNDISEILNDAVNKVKTLLKLNHDVNVEDIYKVILDDGALDRFKRGETFIRIKSEDHWHAVMRYLEENNLFWANAVKPTEKRYYKVLNGCLIYMHEGVLYHDFSMIEEGEWVI